MPVKMALGVAAALVAALAVLETSKRCREWRSCPAWAFRLLDAIVK